MFVRTKAFPAAALISAAVATGAFAQSSDWASYHNERFGYRVLYPADAFRPGQESENGDGLNFFSADGRSKLTVFAAFNTQGVGIEEYRATMLREFPGYDQIGYGPRGGSWFVLSGFRGPNIYYQKVLFSCGGRVVNAFALTYPAEQKRQFDPIVTGIEKNFRTASGSDCELVVADAPAE
jgi:hypothetical protein